MGQGPGLWMGVSQGRSQTPLPTGSSSAALRAPCLATPFGLFVMRPQDCGDPVGSAGLLPPKGERGDGGPGVPQAQAVAPLLQVLLSFSGPRGRGPAS